MFCDGPGLSKKLIDKLEEIVKRVNTDSKTDPTIMIDFGDNYVPTTNFQKWAITYSPAYAYIKPFTL